MGKKESGSCDGIYIHSAFCGPPNQPRKAADKYYIIDNLFFSVMTTRTDQLSIALHVVLHALLIHTRH